jgi:predicted dithiol-disulfide oxidoreductase (DUF899 family)
MAATQPLAPAKEVAKHPFRYPNESAEYRKARTALLAEEIELRRQIEKVAEHRRALPPGGEVPRDYGFIGEQGRVRFSNLFGDKETLITYNFMFRPQRQRPCPMCTSLLSALDGEMPDILQRVAFAVITTSPIERLVAFKKERGWRYLKLYSVVGQEFIRDYVGHDADADDTPAYNVFTRRDGTIRHFWGGEIFLTKPDPEQDPRGAPDLMPIWNILDTTPEGRGKDWYPKLEYPASGQWSTGNEDRQAAGFLSRKA